MSEIQEEYVPVEQIVVTGNLVKRIMNKNIVPAIVTIPLGALMFMLKDVACMIVGGGLILAAVIYLLIIKDRRTFDIYDDCVIVYHDKDPNMARKVMNDEIFEWTFYDSSQQNSCIIFTLNDYSKFAKTTFLLASCVDTLRKTIPDKELRSKQLGAARERIKKFNPFGFRTFSKRRSKHGLLFL